MKKTYCSPELKSVILSIGDVILASSYDAKTGEKLGDDIVW